MADIQESDRQLVLEMGRTSLLTFVALALPRLIPAFVHFSYFDLIAAKLETAIDPLCRQRMVINMPPRHGKSFLVVAVIAYYLGRYPEREVMLVCHSESLAKDLGAKLHTLLESTLFSAVFPNFRLQPGRETVTDFRTMALGGFLAGGPASGLTGRGADLLILDDTVSAQDAQSAARLDNVHVAYDTMLSTRINDPKTGSIVHIAQRVAIHDTTAHLLASGEFEHLSLPFRAVEREVYEYPGGVFTREVGEILQPGRISEEEAKAIESRPAHIYATQYQQMPLAISSGLICERHFPVVDAAPGGGRIVTSWDLASSVKPGSSYSVLLVFEVHEQVSYLRQIRRGRVDYATLQNWARDVEERFRPSTHLVESASLGRAVAAELRSHGANVTEVSPGTSSKLDRVSAVLNKLEAGFIHVVRGTPFLEEFLSECFTFPHGGNDDQVDCVSQFLAWASEQKAPEPKEFRVISPIRRNSRAEKINQMLRQAGQSPRGYRHRPRVRY